MEEIRVVCQAPVISRGLLSVSSQGLRGVLVEQPVPMGEPREDPVEEMLMGE